MAAGPISSLRPLLWQSRRAITSAPARYVSTSRSLSSTFVARASRPRTPLSPSQLVLRQTGRRFYADGALPKPKKRGAFRSVARWTWRLTYLSLLGGLAYVGYGIVLLRNPVEQEEPDPSKKTLVVLGRSGHRLVLTDANPRSNRHRMGLRLAPQEARYRELQRYRHFTPKLFPVHASSSFVHHRYD
jgi:hypothetical protein